MFVAKLVQLYRSITFRAVRPVAVINSPAAKQFVRGSSDWENERLGKTARYYSFFDVKYNYTDTVGCGIAASLDCL